MTNKYGAQPQTLEGIKFYSRWELSVYQLLRRYIPKNHILCHQKILIKPKTSNYKNKYWCVDFVVIDETKNHQLLVEAKGIPTRDFKRQLQLIDVCEPQLIPKIRVVSPTPLRIDECFKAIQPDDLIPELKVIRQEILNRSKTNER